MSVVLTISEKPWSVNAMYANTRPGGGRSRGRFKVAGYRQWRDAMAWEIAIQKPPCFAGRVSVSVQLPQSTRGDVDNRAKAVGDLLQQAGVVANDRQCDPVTIGRADVEKTTITITEVA